MSLPMIEIDNVGKKYRIGGPKQGYLSLRDEIAQRVSPAYRKQNEALQDFWALRGVNFTVEEGEAVGIVGLNGAGKSTLLKILSQITPPTEGQIVMRGRVSSLLEVGTGFHPELTGRENIYLNGAILGMTRREIAKKFDDIVEFSEVAKFLDTPVKRYSSGMYVRLAFGVAAHLEPEILIVDEVLAVGDAAFQRKCLGKMREVAGSGRTVLFVSHNMTAVQNLCKTAVLLRKGHSVAKGETDAIIAEYQSEGAEVTADNRVTSGVGSLSLTVVAADGSDVLRSGTDLKFIADVEVSRPIRNANFGIGIFDMYGNRVTTLHTRFQKHESFSTEKSFKCVVEWKSNFLAPALYRLHAELDDGPEIVATWQDMGRLRIAETDFYGTGKMPLLPNHGFALNQPTWHIEADQ